MAASSKLTTARPEPVEGLSFFMSPEEEQGFYKLSPNGFPVNKAA